MEEINPLSKRTLIKQNYYGMIAKMDLTKMKDKKTTKFDIAEYLDNDEMIKEYLDTVLEEGDSKDIITALGHVAKAMGMTKIAEETGLSRPSLY